jgi:lipoprotein-anchoring transpeptidase ErfK/SrfK
VAKGRHRVRRVGRGVLVLLVLVGVLAIGLGGTTLAAARYEKARADRILPGITVAGVDVGGMTRTQAIQAVSAVIDPRLDRSITVTASGKTWTATAAELGLSTDVAGAVDQALSVGSSYSWMARFYHRAFDKPVGRSFDVPFAFDQAPVAALVGKVQKAVAVKAVSASFALVDGKVQKVHSKDGKALKPNKSIAALSQAVQADGDSVKLPVETIRPDVADGDVGKTIVVDVTKNMLWLYDGFKVQRSYQVATAMPGFVTPDGAWEVVNKAENPTWHNPCLGEPGCWAASEPEEIPPGPGNPLGTRALYLNAPGIRIHGTPSDSSIGSYASHGCIRMHIPDSEALYPLVPVGTPVFIIGGPPWGVSSNPGPAG